MNESYKDLAQALKIIPIFEVDKTQYSIKTTHTKDDVPRILTDVCDRIGLTANKIESEKFNHACDRIFDGISAYKEVGFDYVNLEINQKWTDAHISNEEQFNG